MAGLAAVIAVGLWLLVSAQTAKAVSETINGAGAGYVRLLDMQGKEFQSLLTEPVFIQTLQVALQPASSTDQRFQPIRQAYDRLLAHYRYPGSGARSFHPGGQLASFSQLLDDCEWMYLAEEAQRAGILEETRNRLLGLDWKSKLNVRSRAPMRAETSILSSATWTPETGGTPLAEIQRVIRPADRANDRLLYELSQELLRYHRERLTARLAEVTQLGANAQVVGLVYQPSLSGVAFLDRLQRAATAAGASSTESGANANTAFLLSAGVRTLNEPSEFQVTDDPNVSFRAGQASLTSGSTMRPVAAREYQLRSSDDVRVFVNAEVLGRAQEEAGRAIAFGSIVAILIAIVLALLVGIGLTKPVISLINDVEVIASGNFDHRPQIRSRDEVGKLAELLGEMAVSLKVGQDAWRLSQLQGRDLDMAREIQENLLAKHVPAVPGYDMSAYYSPSREVGGDYYDFFQISDSRIGMVVADVSGKGLPGSMIMMMAKALITYEAMAQSAPKQLFKQVNRFLARDIKRGMFVTAFYIELDTPSKVVRVASAGHVPMLVYREATQKAFSINPGGLALGFDRDGALFERNMKEEAIQLQPGDRVVIYTDGVTEAKSPAGEEFTEQRVMQVMGQCVGMASQDFLSYLVRSIEAHAQTGVQQDDITLVTFRVL